MADTHDGSRRFTGGAHTGDPLDGIRRSARTRLQLLSFRQYACPGVGFSVVALCAATRPREASSSLLYFPSVSRAYTSVNRRKGVAVNDRIIAGAATARLLIWHCHVPNLQ